MIHVQIASQVSMQGVGGLRWVLIDAPENRPEPGVMPVLPMAAAQAASPVPAPVDHAAEADGWKLAGLKLLVVALGLGAAAWTARLQIGPGNLPSSSPTPPFAAPVQASPAHTADRTPDATPDATGDATRDATPARLPPAPHAPSATDQRAPEAPAAAASAALPAAPEPDGAASDATPHLTASLP